MNKRKKTVFLFFVFNIIILAVSTFLYLSTKSQKDKINEINTKLINQVRDNRTDHDTIGHRSKWAIIRSDPKWKKALWEYVSRFGTRWVIHDIGIRKPSCGPCWIQPIFIN